MKKKSKKKLWLFNRRWLACGILSRDLCKYCHGKLLYFCKFDALCCPRCNIWIDSLCNDSNCEYCKARPKTPDMGLEEKDKFVNDKKLYTEKYSHRLKHQNHRKFNRKLKEKKEEN